ncbi:MAG: glycine C-acetyltransferase [Opitutales bacterium]|nr:glycine C-acetyltransferase [Opitutales bacterium]
MIPASFQSRLSQELADLREAGLFKDERIITSAQGGHVRLADGREVLNLCANNYLGLANHPEVRAAAAQTLDDRGFGMASVRFICGTQDLHHRLEERLSAFLGKEDTLLYAACFDANGGVFEPLLGPEDAVVSDQLNHASLIDGIRLCKARRFRYKNNDPADLDARLREAREGGARQIMVATDGVFSMDGIIADLRSIVETAERHDAMLLVDDCHATGFLGARGRGTHEHHGVIDRVDFLTGTLGKALGGASGGYISGPRDAIELLRQRSRPYLFSNTLAPPIAGATLKVLDLLEASGEWRDRLLQNTARYRAGLAATGLATKGDSHPIVPVMVGDAALSQRIAARLLELGVYVVGFFFPVVPRGEARIRTQISAAHAPDDIDFALDQWAKVQAEFRL